MDPSVNDDAATKVCSRCDTAYPLTPEYFYRDRTRSTGFDARCKQCSSDASPDKGVSSQVENRNDYDYYPTPSWCVDRLLEHVTLPGGRWLEPCAGNGNLIKAVNAVRSPLDVEWDACEIQDRFKGKLDVLGCKSVHIGDFLALPPTPKYDVIFTNPPYGIVGECIMESLRRAHYVAMLLRLNVMVSDKRAAFIRRNMFDMYILPNRPYFGPGVSDAEYAWFVWGPERARRRGTVILLDDTSAMERRESERFIFD